MSFTDDGVDAATILTYGMSTDPTRAASSDQTELFSQERWVDFPFTTAEVAGDAVETYTVVGPRSAAPDADAGSPAAVAPPVRARALPATGGAPLAAVAVVVLAGAGVLRRRSSRTA